ncbi:SMEK domain-containing protein [Microcoleus sp. AR_TQ3_B6]|uniref:SMEK domain-containing protein n=1 Tax=Microcoleus sp. AR_TQ3_B6 TaxID=3055284 RepID=UPI002FD0AD39
MNLERVQKRIRDLMSLFVIQVKSAIPMQKTDINKVAQTILIPLIAEVYGYQNLKDLDFTEGRNFPSVDLGDETARVAFQITATRDIEKVKDTLTKFVFHKLYEKYDRIIIYIITDRQKDYSDTEINKIIQGKLSFDVKNDIWDYRNILGEVAKFQIEKAREVEKILEANFGEERKEPDWEVVDKVEQIINKSTELFVGGSENFQKLDNFLADNSSGVMLVTAGAGFGKTSLLANWVDRERQGERCFIAYHFFSQQHDKTRYVKSAYWNLLRQIYRYYELYHEQLPNELDELRKRLYNILKERGASQDKPLVIVIDALDEIDAAEMPFSLPFLTPLPQNVFVIVSARAESEEEPKYLENWTEKSQKLHLKNLPREAIADWLKQTGEGELAVFAEDINFVTQLDEITQGFPLYLSYLIDELSHAAKQKQDIRQLLAQTPKGFENYVKQQLKRLDELNLPDEMWQFFALLAVAKGALEKQDVKAITGMGDRPLRKLHQCWQVTRWMRISEDNLYAFAHPLLATTFAAQLGDEAEDALQNLMNYCSQWQEHHSSYALRYYAEHLSEAKQWEALYAIARNEDFYSHSIKQFPDEPDLPLKTVQTALLAAAEEDKAGEMAEFMLLHARQLLQTTAQDSPLDALRKGSLERAWRLTDLYEIERRILWYLLLAWELKDTDRFEEAEETLKRLQQQELPRLSTNQAIEWHSEYATYLLAQVFEVSENICTSLEQKLFDNSYRCTLCAHLRNSGNFTAALKTVESIRPESKQVLELINIAKAQAQKGDIEYSATFTNALEIVNTLVSTSDWETLIKEIAKAQIEVADRASAQATLTEALETADNKIDNPLHLSRANGIANEEKQTDFLQKIVIEQAEARELADARETAKKIDYLDRPDALMRIAEAYAKAGDFTTALEIATEIDIQLMRAETLGVIAELQAQAGQTEAARATFANVLKSEQKPKILISFMRASALAIVAKVQVKNAQKEVGAATACMVGEIAQSIDNPVGTANLLAGILVEILIEAEKIQEAKIICDRAYEIAQQISDNQEYHRSKTLGFVAEAQAKLGEFDVALTTLETIRMPYSYVNALRSIVELQIEADPQQIEKCKIALNDADEYYKNADSNSLILANKVRLLTIIAVARSTIGETEAALATLADLLEAAKTKEQRKRDQDFSIIAIGYAEVGEFSTAIKISTDIEDGEHKISTFLAIAEEQFQKGEQVTTLDIALAAQEKIEDEQKRLEALKSIAQIQAIAGKGEEALRTLEAMLSDRNTHLRDIALLFAETGDRVNFKRLLIPCAYYLDTAYQMCGYLARLYPEQASAVAKVLSELNEGEQ